NSASEAVDEIDGPGMINAAAHGWECRDASEETVCREWKRIEVVKALQRARRAHNYRQHVTRTDKSRKRRDAPAWNIRVKRRRRIQPLLNRQFQAACTHITHFDAAVTEQFVLYAQGPGDDLWRYMIRNERSGCRSSVCLRHRRNVYLQQSAELQESLPGRWIGWIGRVESSAPLRCTRQRARQAGVLFRLQLWRQTVDGKVVWHDVIRQAGTAADRPLAVAARVPGKTESGRKVVGVRLWRAEKQPERWIVRNTVDCLQIFVARNAAVLVTQSKVQR